MFNGYVPENEDRGLLMSQSIGPEWADSIGVTAEPKEYDCADWFNIRNQGNVGSCRGHSLACTGEMLAMLKAGTIDLDRDGDSFEKLDDRFSPGFAYYMSQRKSGKNGISGDRGATISGGVRVAEEDGFCPENLLPYKGRYSPQVSYEAKEAASKFKVKQTWILDGPEDEPKLWEWTQAGIGWFDMGVTWPLPFMRVEGTSFVVDNRRIKSSRKGGGHAIAAGGIIRPNGVWMYKIVNSHGIGAQDKGYFYVTRRGMQRLLEHPHTVVACYSDLTNIRRRRFDWSKESLFI